MSVGPQMQAKWCRYIQVHVEEKNREAFIAAIPIKTTRIRYDESHATMHFAFGEDIEIKGRFHMYWELMGPTSDAGDYDDEAPQPDGLHFSPEDFAAAIALTKEGEGKDKIPANFTFRASGNPHLTGPPPRPYREGEKPMIRIFACTVNEEFKQEFVPICRAKMLARRLMTDWTSWGQDLFGGEGIKFPDVHVRHHFAEVHKNQRWIEETDIDPVGAWAWDRFKAREPSPFTEFEIYTFQTPP
jgi:hypothetical protein